jgi:hypothetical protein
MSVLTRSGQNIGQKIDSERTYPNKDTILFYHVSGDAGSLFPGARVLVLWESAANLFRMLAAAVVTVVIVHDC